MVHGATKRAVSNGRPVYFLERRGESKIDDDLLEAGLHVPDSNPTLRNDEGVAGMEFVSRAVGVDGRDIALQHIDELVEWIVARLEHARLAAPEGDLVAGKDS